MDISASDLNTDRSGGRRRNVVDGKKWCNDCQDYLPLSEFYVCRGGRQSYQSYCMEHRRIRNREWMKGHRERGRMWSRALQVRKKYGLTLGEYRTLLMEPCAICGKSSEVIDHTVDGSFHAPLCSKCNTAIGFLNHDASTLRAAADYVERTRGH